ncbi:ABC transporter ATP-binding protein [Cytobacillus gottheilii]|uniref:ABC transporter ATP-binding protein n=1 Tax=Cytobacillus gottheilii TaxID=859144 RepID=A0ABX8F929_9BACI|nr:ABC transporter ATP-binding protein [Cytobacillus gottheilii]QVY60936.1 ABC transporter ATP-binding protein [Cytobacillus gottheilii]
MNINRHRKAIETMYTGLCTISEYQSVRDPVTKRTKQEEVSVLSGQACHLSFKTIPAANQRDNATTIAQTTKLFIAPELEIKAGSKITVTQNGVTTSYSQSGLPAVYPTHQEISLKLFEGWA